MGKEEIYIADLKLPGIWVYRGEKLEIVVQGTSKYRTPLNAIRCLAVTDDGTLLAGDSATPRGLQGQSQGAATALTNGYVGIPITMAPHADRCLRFRP